MTNPRETDPPSLASVLATSTGLGISTGDDNRYPQSAAGDGLGSFLSPRIHVEDVLEAEGTGSRPGSPGRSIQGFSRPMPQAVGRVMGGGRYPSSTRTGSSGSDSRSRSQSRRPPDTGDERGGYRYDLRRGLVPEEEQRAIDVDKVEELLEKGQEKDERIGELEREIDRLKDEIDSENERTDELRAELEGKIAKLESEVAELKATARDFKIEAAEKKRQVDQMEDQLEGSKRAVNKAEEKMEQLNKKVSESEGSYEYMEKTIGDLEQANTILKIRNEKLREENEELKEQADQMEEELPQAAPDDDVVKSRRLTKRETWGDKDREFEEYMKKLGQAELKAETERQTVEHQNHKIKNLEENLASSRTSRADLEAKKEELSQENDKLQKQSFTAQKNLEYEQKVHQEHRKAWESEKEGFAKEIDLLQRKEKHTADDRRNGIQQLNDSITEHQNKISELQDKNKLVEDKNQQLQRTLKIYKKGLSDEPIRQSIAKTQLEAEKGIMQNALDSLGHRIERIDLSKLEEGVRLVDDTKHGLDALSAGGDATRQVRQGIYRNLNHIQELLQGPIGPLKDLSDELEHSTRRLKKEEEAWKEGNEEIVAIIRRLEDNDSKGKAPASPSVAEFERASFVNSLKEAVRKMDKGISKSQNPTEAIRTGTIHLTKLSQRDDVNERDIQLIRELQDDLQKYLEQKIGDQNIRDELRELLKRHRRALDEKLKHSPDEPRSDLEKKIEQLESEQSAYHRKKIEEYGAIINERPPGTLLKASEAKKLQDLTNAYVEDLPENRVVAFFAGGDSPQERRAVGLEILVEKVKRLQLREVQDIHTWLPSLRPAISEHTAKYAELLQEQRKLQAKAESLARERLELSRPERGRSTISRAEMDAGAGKQEAGQHSKHEEAEQLRLQEEHIRRELRLNSTRLDRLFSNKQLFTHWVENLEKTLHREAETLVMQVLLEFALDRLLDKSRREACFCSLLEYFLPKVYNATARAHEPPPEPPQQRQILPRVLRHSVSTVQATGRSTTFAVPRTPRTPQPPTARCRTDFKQIKPHPRTPHQQIPPTYEDPTTRHGHGQGHLLISPSLSIFAHYTYPYICQLLTAFIWLVLLILFQPVNLYKIFGFMTSVIVGLPVYIIQCLRFYLYKLKISAQDDDNIRKTPQRITFQLGKRKRAAVAERTEGEAGDEDDDHEDAKKVKDERRGGGAYPVIIPILRKAGSDLGLDGEGPSSSSAGLGVLVEEPQEEEGDPDKETFDAEAGSETQTEAEEEGEQHEAAKRPWWKPNLPQLPNLPKLPKLPLPPLPNLPLPQLPKLLKLPNLPNLPLPKLPNLPLPPSLKLYPQNTYTTLLRYTTLARQKLTYHPNPPRPPSAATVLGSLLSIFLVYSLATYLAARAERRVWTGNDIVWKHAYLRDLELSSSRSAGARPSPYASSESGSGAYLGWSPARVDFRLVYAPGWWRVVEFGGEVWGGWRGLGGLVGGFEIKGWEYLVGGGRWIGKGPGELVGFVGGAGMKGWKYVVGAGRWIGNGTEGFLGLAGVSWTTAWEYLGEFILRYVGRFRELATFGEELGYNPRNWPVVILAMGVVASVGWYARSVVEVAVNFLWERVGVDRQWLWVLIWGWGEAAMGGREVDVWAWIREGAARLGLLRYVDTWATLWE